MTGVSKTGHEPRTAGAQQAHQEPHMTNQLETRGLSTDAGAKVLDALWLAK